MALQSTVASIQNIRKQRQLELELLELDRKWHEELKALARERLALVKELCRLNQTMQEVDHFQDSMRGRDLARFTSRAHHRQQHDKEAKEIHKFSFQADPAQKVALHLPLIREEDGAEADPGQTLTSKDLNKQRVQLQKFNSEQHVAHRRTRRRPFWDKAVIGSRTQQLLKDRPGFLRGPPRAPGAAGVLGSGVVVPQTEVAEEVPVVARGLSKSPSLPALNRIHRLDTFKVVNAVHPSLSKRHSASMDYLPVIRGARVPKPGVVRTSWAPSVSSRGLPTIVEG